MRRVHQAAILTAIAMGALDRPWVLGPPDPPKPKPEPDLEPWQKDGCARRPGVDLAEPGADRTVAYRQATAKLPARVWDGVRDGGRLARAEEKRARKAARRLRERG